MYCIVVIPWESSRKCLHNIYADMCIQDVMEWHKSAFSGKQAAESLLTYDKQQAYLNFRHKNSECRHKASRVFCSIKGRKTNLTEQLLSLARVRAQAPRLPMSPNYIMLLSSSRIIDWIVRLRLVSLCIFVFKSWESGSKQASLCFGHWNWTICQKQFHSMSLSSKALWHCIHMYAYMYTHIYEYLHLYMCLYICMCVYMYAFIYACICTCIHARI